MSTGIKFEEIDYNPNGTRVSFSMNENALCIVEFDAVLRSTQKRVRLQASFSGSAAARVMDPQDRELNSKGLITLINQSQWVDESLNDYISRFGTKLLPVVSNIKHYLLSGHDMQIGVLARSVNITIIEVIQ